MNEIAQTILAQLGGNKFLAMTGAQCLAGAADLTVKLPKLSRLSCVVIELDQATDTYRFQGYRGRGVGLCKYGPTLDGLHADQLAKTFELHTGLAVSL
jgi:phage/plasmid primase-like uncharacterized protein